MRSRRSERRTGIGKAIGVDIYIYIYISLSLSLSLPLEKETARGTRCAAPRRTTSIGSSLRVIHPGALSRREAGQGREEPYGRYETCIQYSRMLSSKSSGIMTPVLARARGRFETDTIAR